MELKDIISIPGTGGLYKVVAQSKNGFIVESLTDNKRMPISASQRISSLVDIALFTKNEDMPLKDVFKKIQETDGGKLSVDPKADQKILKDYFKKIVPDFDEERVYASDMKKILTWYELLSGKIDFTAKEESSDEDKINITQESGRPVPKVHESHSPKADQHAKVGQVKLRKKV
ncbi:MAG: DUF5606 domain-containing protein [Bacteroidetes bacterium]|nr:DUF5606 domain-containing protein [Bacteroidota bacterium]